MSIEPFLNYLKDEKRYSSLTLLAYKKDLEQFLTYCATINDLRCLDDVTPKIVREWVMINMSEGKTVTTVRRKLSTLRTFFRFLMKYWMLR